MKDIQDIQSEYIERLREENRKMRQHLETAVSDTVKMQPWQWDVWAEGVRAFLEEVSADNPQSITNNPQESA